MSTRASSPAYSSLCPAPAAGLSAVAGPARLNVHAFGMNLRAATTADCRDGKQLHRLAKYLLRPPFAQHAVAGLPDGRVRPDIPRRNRSVTMTPEQFIAKLIALVPAPGVRMIYAGDMNRLFEPH